jgi:heterodisulfide reductase subunit A-like polyferredoxin
MFRAAFRRRLNVCTAYAVIPQLKRMMSSTAAGAAERRVVVIGGGITGLSTLRQLTNLGVQRPLLLEAETLTAGGSTWHAAGLVNPVSTAVYFCDF